MPENYENDKRYENTKQKIDGLDRNINDLDSKIQDREDFSKYVKDLESIYNDFRTLDDDIDNIVDVEKKKELKDSLDNLKIIMLDLISDWNIDSLINGETKDKVINDMVWKVDDIFWNEMTNLVNGLELWDWKINEVLSDTWPLTESRLKEIVQFWWVPYWTLSVEWQDYFWFVLPWSWEIYALVNWNLKICEWVLDDISWNSVWNDKKKKGNSWFSVTHSQKLVKAGIDTTWVKDTWKVSKNLGNWFSTIVSLDSQWPSSATPWLWVNYTWLNTKIWDLWLNTQLTASYSPWSISWAVEWWRKDKDVFKFKVWETFKFKNGFNFSIYEIFKTSDFSKLRSSNFSTELKASRKLSSNIKFSGIANFDYKWKPSFLWVGANIRI